ncbi:MAG: pyridoxamine 5'-phosphate oxidase [Candidatus Hydrogenedentota bacterium]
MAIPRNRDPLATFAAWFEEALARQDETVFHEPTACTLCTTMPDGTPDGRIVLLKHFDERGFVVYTNLESPKAQQLDANPRATLVFYWMPLDKQVRVTGDVERVTEAEADAYHASRPKQSQIGAWASKQSQPLEGRFELERRVAQFAARYAVSKVPRPDFWSGYRIKPERIEFWLKQPYRLHERLEYRRSAEGEWETRYLYP